MSERRKVRTEGMVRQICRAFFQKCRRHKAFRRDESISPRKYIEKNYNFFAEIH